MNIDNSPGHGDSEEKAQSRGGEFSPEGEDRADNSASTQKGFQRLMDMYLKNPTDARIQKLLEKSKKDGSS